MTIIFFSPSNSPEESALLKNASFQEWKERKALLAQKEMWTNSTEKDDYGQDVKIDNAENNRLAELRKNGKVEEYFNTLKKLVKIKGEALGPERVTDFEKAYKGDIEKPAANPLNPDRMEYSNAERQKFLKPIEQTEDRNDANVYISAARAVRHRNFLLAQGNLNEGQRAALENATNLIDLRMRLTDPELQKQIEAARKLFEATRVARKREPDNDRPVRVGEL